MNFKIFDKPVVKEKEVFFKLNSFDGETISLVACDETGERYSQGCILSILPDGRVRLHNHVNGELGLKLDGRSDRIAICYED